jgi:hypothetical protein
MVRARGSGAENITLSCRKRGPVEAAEPGRTGCSDLEWVDVGTGDRQ